MNSDFLAKDDHKNDRIFPSDVLFLAMPDRQPAEHEPQSQVVSIARRKDAVRRLNRRKNGMQTAMPCYV